MFVPPEHARTNVFSRARSTTTDDATPAHPPLKPLYVIDSSVRSLDNNAQLRSSTASIFATSKGAVGIDFKNEEAQRQLTQALLSRDFGLTLGSLPSDRLCPPVPNRVDYVLWIQDIVDKTFEVDPGTSSVLGIDMSVLASLILTGGIPHDSNLWGALDIDKKSLLSAEKNIASNILQEQITLWTSKPNEKVLSPIFANPEQRFMFTMCNPPFYSSYSEAVNSPIVKEFDPFAVCTGAEVEMVTEGGEVGFVRRIIMESKELGERCSWYTSLLGKSSSVASLVETLKEQSIDNYGVTELVQSHTKRWVILWSFGDIRLPDTLCRVSRSQFAGHMPHPNNMVQAISQTTVSGVISSTLTILNSLPAVRWSQTPQGDVSQPVVITASATANCWSRSARRKAGAFSDDGPAVLTCQFTVTSEADSKVNLYCQWVRGRERGLFESFWSHVSRKVAEKQ
ncbi:hypothetical protein M407DRAFT_30076 [Tulasnella calospora MUT 4182]|uniref:U6 small nuclear RNA (adenine-(43)-N(6))-methyltransferase n=1 Tax=Tulasnella calospora MUT 4182 TaxID=1051891 RepID=A0A0C3PYF3_9AGAM|nr:hypothetical protein M407DRAFT_30076 [Tulasnella calospora MUT 4182]